MQFSAIFAIALIATQAIITPATAKNILIFDLIRHKHRQHPRVVIQTDKLNSKKGASAVISSIILQFILANHGMMFHNCKENDS